MSEDIGQFHLNNVRLSFPSIVEPQAPYNKPNDPKKYKASFLLSPNDPQYAQFMETVRKVAAAKWGEQASNRLNVAMGANTRRCFGSGNEKISTKSGKIHDGYENMVFITTTNTEARPPTICALDSVRDCENPLERATVARKMYGGCYVNAVINIWAQDNPDGCAIRASLTAIQFEADGQPFGNPRPDVSALFKPVQQSAQPAVPMPQGQPAWNPQQPSQPQQPAFTPGQFPPGWPNMPWNA